MYEEGLTIPYSDLSPRVSDVALVICGNALRNIHHWLVEQIENNDNTLSQETNKALVECCAWYLAKLSFYNNFSSSNSVDETCNNNKYLLDEDKDLIRRNKRTCNSVIESRKDYERQNKRQKIFEKDFYTQVCVSEASDKHKENENNNLKRDNERSKLANTFNGNDVNFPLAVNTLVLHNEVEQIEQYEWNECNESVSSECNTKQSIDAGLSILFELLSKTSAYCGDKISRQLAVEMIDLLSVNRWIYGIVDSIEEDDICKVHVSGNEYLQESTNALTNANRCARFYEIVKAELQINTTNSLTTLCNLLESDNLEHESLYAFGSLTCGFSVWVKVAWGCASFKHQCELAFKVSQWCRSLWMWIEQSYVHSLESKASRSSLHNLLSTQSYEEEWEKEEGEYRTDKSVTAENYMCNAGIQKTELKNTKSDSKLLLFEPLVMDVMFMRQQLRDFIIGTNNNNSVDEYESNNSNNMDIKSLRVNPHHYRHLIMMEESMLLYLSHISCALLPPSTQFSVFIDLLIANSSHRQSALTHAELNDDDNNNNNNVMWGSFQTATKPILERVAHGLLVRAVMCMVLHSLPQAEECVQTVMFITHQLHSRVLSALTHYCHALLCMMSGQASKACDCLTIVLELCKSCLSSSHAFISDNATSAQDEDIHDISDSNDCNINDTRHTDGDNANSARSNSTSNINAARQTNHVNDTHVSSIGVDEDKNECDNEKMDAIWANNVQKEELQRIISCTYLTLAQLLIFFPGIIPSETRIAVMSMHFQENSFNLKCQSDYSINNYKNNNGTKSSENRRNINICTRAALSRERQKFTHVNLHVYDHFVEKAPCSTVENESQVQRTYGKSRNSNFSATLPTTETIAQATQHLLHLSQITAETNKYFLTQSQPLLVTSYYPACLLSIHNINSEIVQMQSSIYGVACEPLHFDTHVVMKHKELLDSHVFVSDMQRQMMHQLLLNAMATHVAQYVLCVQHELLIMHDTTPLKELVTFMTAIEKCYGRRGQDWLNQHTYFVNVIDYICLCRLEEQGYTQSAYEAICALVEKLLRNLRYTTKKQIMCNGNESKAQMYFSPQYLMLFALVQLTHAKLCVLLEKQQKMLEISSTLAHISTTCEFAFGVIVSEYISLLQWCHRDDAKTITHCNYQWNALIEKTRAIGFTPIASYILRSKVEWYMQEGKWEQALGVIQLLSNKYTLNSTWYKITWLNITCALLIKEYYNTKGDGVNECQHSKLENLIEIVLTNLYYFNQIKAIGVKVNEECHVLHTRSHSNSQHVINESMWKVKETMKRDNELSSVILGRCSIALTFRELLCVNLSVEQIITLLNKHITQTPLFAVLFLDKSSICTHTALLLRTLRWRQEQKGMFDTLQMYYIDDETDHYLLAMCKALQSNYTAQHITSQQKAIKKE